MSKKSRTKGATGEREVVNLLKSHGFEAERRAPLQAGFNPSDDGDVLWNGYGRIEVKRRKDGFKQIYDFLGENEYLAIRADRKPWLVVMPIETLLQYAAVCEKFSQDLDDG